MPKELEEMYQRFKEKVRRGDARMFKNKNQSGRGFKFDEEEDLKMSMVKKLLQKSYGFELTPEEEKEIEEMQKS